MIRTARISIAIFFLLSGLTLVVAATSFAQTPETSVGEIEPADQAITPPEAGTVEPDAVNDSGSCPRCGRQQRRRGSSASSENNQEQCGGCRCGRGQGPRGQGWRSPDAGETGEPTRGRGPWAGRRGGGKRDEMTTYRALLENHDSIERTFENVPGGIRSVTTTSDPELAVVLQRHVSQMVDLLENGGWIRMWDPLFAEIFEHADKIETVVEEIDGGVAVTETSNDDQVAALIRAHAAKVMEFTASGFEAYDEPTPLPEGYESPGR